MCVYVYKFYNDLISHKKTEKYTALPVLETMSLVIKITLFDYVESQHIHVEISIKTNQKFENLIHLFGYYINIEYAY